MSERPVSDPPIVLVDMDGPLAAFDQHFHDRCAALGFRFDVTGPHEQRHRYFTDHLSDPAEALVVPFTDAQRDAMWCNLNSARMECERHRFGSTTYDPTLDHIYEQITLAMNVLGAVGTRSAHPAKRDPKCGWCGHRWSDHGGFGSDEGDGGCYGDDRTCACLVFTPKPRTRKAKNLRPGDVLADGCKIISVGVIRNGDTHRDSVSLVLAGGRNRLFDLNDRASLAPKADHG